jgi:hypothetical protein
LYSVEQKFHTEDEKPKNLGFEPGAPKKCAPCFRGTRKFLFIPKIKDGGWNEKIHFSSHLGFFEKLFSQNWRHTTTKILDILRVMSKNLVLIRHFGSNRHF